MNICVVGAGYLGLTTSIGLASLHNQVISVDRDETTIAELKQGNITIFEPGLEPALKNNLETQRLLFTTSLQEGVTQSEMIIVAVGTPPNKDGSVDLTQVMQVVTEIGKYLDNYKIIVMKSTVPVGTSKAMARLIRNNLTGSVPFDLLSNPEFLREGSALHDFLHPDRIIIGGQSIQAIDALKHLYRNLDAPIYITSAESAEMIKYTANAFLATKISFINEIASLCEKLAVDVTEVAQGVGMDPRIGPAHLEAGIGFGGSCLPKDVMALLSIGASCQCDLPLLTAVLKVNRDQIDRFVHKIATGIYSVLRQENPSVAVLGLSFKPDTDDLREAPSLAIIAQLIKKGFRITIYDPAATAKAIKLVPSLTSARDPYQAVTGCDAVLLLTEWPEFFKLDWDRIKKLLCHPLVFDGRNILEPTKMARLGFVYHGLGRGCHANKHDYQE